MSAEEKNALLIVDDEELNRAILANIFQTDYDTLEAEDGQQALELIEGTSHPAGCGNAPAGWHPAASHFE